MKCGFVPEFLSMEGESTDVLAPNVGYKIMLLNEYSLQLLCHQQPLRPRAFK